MISGENLLARLGLDTTGFKAGLKDAHGAFKTFGGGLAGLLSVGGLAAATKSIITYGSTIQDLADRFKISTTALQKFGNAGEELGTSLEGVAAGFNKLEISQARALAGGEAQIKAFANLGISIEDLRTLSPEELMLKMGKSSLDAASMVAVLGKSALELRPLLEGLGDGTVQLGEAIDADLIRQLDEADDRLKKMGQTIKILGANVLGKIFDEMKFITTGVAGMWNALTAIIVADFRLIKAAATGNFAEVNRQMHISSKAFHDFNEAAFGDPGKNKPAGGDAAAPGKPRAQREPPEKPPSRAELAAQKKDRERDQLSLKELQTEGPANFNANATAQMMYAAQQARLVDQLEAQAKQVRLTGISPTGETSGGLMARADAIRQTLPIKESEKEVGIWRQAIKEGMGETNELLSQIRDQTE